MRARDVEERCGTWFVICECMWVGSAMPPGSGCEPATHTRPSPPDWANSVGMRGCVCRGILPQPPTGAATVSPRQVGPKGKCLVIGAKPCERLQGDSWSQQCWGGQVLGDASSGGMRGEFIWCYSKPRQRSVRQQHFCSGTVKVSHSSSTWARLPAAALRVLPRDLSVTLK